MSEKKDISDLRRKQAIEVEDKAMEKRKTYWELKEKVWDMDTFRIKSKEELPELIEKKKRELSEVLIAYMEENNVKSIPYSQVYQLMSSGNVLNRTRYSADELAIAFEVYKEVTATINKKNKKHAPTKQNFCAFIGISTSTFDSYKEQDDPTLNEVAKRIEDYITDVQLQMAQMGQINPGTTMFRMKTEHGYVEPKEIVYTNTQKSADRDDIRKRLSSVSDVIDVDLDDKKG